MATEDGKLCVLKVGSPATFTWLKRESGQGGMFQLKVDAVVAKFVRSMADLADDFQMTQSGRGRCEKVIRLAKAWSAERDLAVLFPPGVTTPGDAGQDFLLRVS